MTKIETVEQAFKAIGEADYYIMFHAPRNAWIYSYKYSPDIGTLATDDELIEFARECQLKAFW